MEICVKEINNSFIFLCATENVVRCYIFGMNGFSITDLVDIDSMKYLVFFKHGNGKNWMSEQ